MTRILWYTDGTTSTSFSGSSPLSFGTAKTRQTTNTGLYDNVLVPGLTAMGWTQSNQATRDDTWTSTGESGLESINFRTQYDGSNFLNIYPGTKVNGSGVLQGSIGGGHQTYDSWNIGSSNFTSDYLLLGTKDFMVFIVRLATAGLQPANTFFTAYIGNLERDGTSNPITMTTTGTATAGSMVSIPVQQNVYASGYKPGDIVQIVSTAITDAAQAQTVRVIGITSSTITVDSISATYSTGARIGASPSPIVRFMGLNQDPTFVSSTTNWYSPLSSTLLGATSDLVATPGQNLTAVDLSTGKTPNATQDGFGNATTSNTRTNRFTCRSLELKTINEVVVGRVAGIYAYPGTIGTFPNDTAVYNQVSPVQNYILTTFGGTLVWCIGKSP